MNKISKKLLTEFQTSRNLLFLVFTFCMVATLSFFVSGNTHHSSAANPNNFNAGNIISDAVMANYTSMTEQDIQNFLDSKNSCDNRNYDLYLQYTKAHPTITWHWEGEPYNGHFVCLAEEKFGDTASEIGTGKTAAQIIYEAAQEYRINPQVLLVLLQKESSLITDKVPNSFDYGQATGYGCPDTAACDKKYSGFKNQVSRAAELFRYVLDHNSVYYPAGRTVYVGYHPSSSCGGTQVKIENRATAALYQYTPYQPNAASLNAGYGQGDSCSAYGNRNFYLYFTDWFGSTTDIEIKGEKILVPDGEYSLSFAGDKERTLGVSGNNVQLAKFDMNDENQRWRIQRNKETGYYELTNVKTKQLLATQETGINERANVIVNNTNTCSKWWRIYQSNDGYIMLETTCSQGMMLDVRNGASAVGTNIEMYAADDTKAQKWVLDPGQTLSDGVYVIYSSLHKNRVIDVAGLNSNNGTNLQLWEHYDAGYQEWSVVYEPQTRSYIITSPQTNRSLEVTGASKFNGANIQQWTEYGTCGHRWKIVDTQDGNYTMVSSCGSNYTVDVRDGNTSMGTNIELWEANNSDAQKWQFALVDSAPVNIRDGVYSFLSKADNVRAIDVMGLGKADNTNVWLWEKYNGGAQKWRLTYNKLTNDYNIADLNSGKFLAATSKVSQNGVNIVITSDKQSCSSRWRIRLIEEGYHELVSSCTKNKIVDIMGAKTSMGTNIWLWNEYNYDTQKWKLISEQ